VLLLAGVCLLAGAPAAAQAAVEVPAQANIQQQSAKQVATPQAASAEKTGASLESAAAKAGDTARTVAMSLIGLALAIASIVLAFRRDFKEAAGVFAVGIVAVLLATPAGLSLLQDTVTSLFGA
jgi:phage-related tail protein